MAAAAAAPSRLVRGLPNQGATCYFNAAIQMLQQATPLKLLVQQLALMQDLPEDDAERIPTPKPTCWRMLWQEFLGAYGRDSADIAGVLPRLRQLPGLPAAEAKPRFMRGSQEDAHDYITGFLEAWQGCCDCCRFVVRKLFGIKLVTNVLCCACGTQTDHKTTETTFCVPIPEDPTLTIVDSLRAMLQPTQSDAPVDCATCGRKTLRTHTMRVARWPHCLVLQWKRPAAPVRLPPHPVVHGIAQGALPGDMVAPLVLRGIAHGGGVHGGHYVASVRDVEGHWWNANDTSVAQITPPAQHAALSDTCMLYTSLHQ